MLGTKQAAEIQTSQRLISTGVTSWTQVTFITSLIFPVFSHLTGYIVTKGGPAEYHIQNILLKLKKLPPPKQTKMRRACVLKPCETPTFPCTAIISIPHLISGVPLPRLELPARICSRLTFESDSAFRLWGCNKHRETAFLIPYFHPCWLTNSHFY